MDATVNALTSQVGDMQSRMTRMESVLEQLVQALNKQTPSQILSHSVCDTVTVEVLQTAVDQILVETEPSADAGG